jgi:hypothetical protein
MAAAMSRAANVVRTLDPYAAGAPMSLPAWLN